MVARGHVPGTSLVRALAPEKGWEWMLSIGSMMMPKSFYTGKTIGECLAKAEAELL